MTHSIKFLTTFVTIILLSSFTGSNTNHFTGTYGVPDSDPSRIKLTIKADNTFYYQDFSNPDKKISVNGHWTVKGNKVILKSSGSGDKFHNIWIIKKNGQVASSHKGLAFYRLCKIEG